MESTRLCLNERFNGNRMMLDIYCNYNNVDDINWHVGMAKSYGSRKHHYATMIEGTDIVHYYHFDSVSEPWWMHDAYDSSNYPRTKEELEDIGYTVLIVSDRRKK